MKQEVKPWFFQKKRRKVRNQITLVFVPSCGRGCVNLPALGRADAARCGDLLGQAAGQRGQNNGTGH